MTKEELEKEAEEKLLQAELDYCHELSNPCEPSELPYSELLRFETGYKRGYLASAEPREKRITGLEVTNKRLADECHKLVRNLEKKQIQIEKMKCCENCKRYKPCVTCNETIGNNCDYYSGGNVCDKWEINENE